MDFTHVSFAVRFLGATPPRKHINKWRTIITDGAVLLGNLSIGAVTIDRNVGYWHYTYAFETNFGRDEEDYNAAGAQLLRNEIENGNRNLKYTFFTIAAVPILIEHLKITPYNYFSVYAERQ
jgi:hypothetical protein